MSKSNENLDPTINSDEEIIIEGVVIDSEPTPPGRIASFFHKNKTLLIAGAAAVGGFILGGLLSASESDACQIEYSEDDDPVASIEE